MKNFASLILIALSVAWFGNSEAKAELRLDRGWQYQWQMSDRSKPSESDWIDTELLELNSKGPNQNLWLRVPVPDYSEIRDPHLSILRASAHFEVFLGEQKIYQFGEVSHQERFLFQGYPTHYIPLKKGASPEQHFVFLIQSNFSMIGLIEPKVASKSDIILQSLVRDWRRLMVSIICTFIGLMGLFSLTRLGLQKEVLLFSLITIGMGLNAFAAADLKEFYYYSPLFWKKVEYVSLIIAITAFYFFTSMAVTPGRNNYIVHLSHSFLALCTMSLFACLSDVVSILVFLQIAQGMVIVTAPFMIISGLAAAKRGDDIVKAYVMGLVMMGLFGLYDAFISLVYSKTQTVSDIGSLWLAVSLLVFMIKRVDEKKEELINKEQSLLDAKTVQEALLPNKEQCSDLNVITHYSTADETGGDWYDYHYDKEKKWAYFIIADVTGHGVASALVTGAAAGATKAFYHSIQGKDISMEEALKELATTLNIAVQTAGHRNGRGMTAALLCMDIETGQGRYLNCGHHQFYHISNGELFYIQELGPILGMEDRPDFDVFELNLTPGDQFFFFTDGLIENYGPGKQAFLTRKLEKILTKNQSVEHKKSEILNQAQSVWKEEPQADDVTFAFVHWKKEDEQVQAA